MNKVDVSKRLKELINLNNMNISEFSEYVGITRTSLTGYLNQKVTPTIDPLVQICDKCGVSLDWLCGRENASHFYTGADLINFFLELKKLKYLDYSIDFIEIDIDTPNGLDTLPLVRLTFDKERYPYHFLSFGSIELSTFMRDYKELETKLASLNDSQLSENYMKMWLDQQLAHYSSYKIEKLEDIEE